MISDLKNIDVHYHFKTRPRVLIIEAPFHEKIVSWMRKGAIKVIADAGVDYDVVAVPGALEIPVALSLAVKANKYDAFVVLGCIIRGETTHYETVANESNRKIMDICVAHDVCLGNAILTVENMEQALERADTAKQNKGGWAVVAALDMLNLKNKMNRV